LVIGRWLADRQPPLPRAAWRQAIAVDGKTLRGSDHHGHRPYNARDATRVLPLPWHHQPMQRHHLRLAAAPLGLLINDHLDPSCAGRFERP
jgi:hypothetical protein